VNVRDRVLEVDELGAEQVLVARGDANVGFAEGPADDLASVEILQLHLK
jgi:5,10-methylenetetrahydrofolate reductase